MGIINYVIKDVLEVVAANQVTRVGSVTMCVGEVTGAINEYLIDYWNWARKKEPILAETELIIETIKAVTFCVDCKQEYETVAYGKICPHCKSEHTYLLRGNEYMLKQIEAE